MYFSSQLSFFSKLETHIFAEFSYRRKLSFYIYTYLYSLKASIVCQLLTHTLANLIFLLDQVRCLPICRIFRQDRVYVGWYRNIHVT